MNGMSKRIRRELAKLRELTHHLLDGRTCYFCRERLTTAVAPPGLRGGDGTGPVFTAKITIHHIDGDHANDAPENKALAHGRCHRAYHLRQRRAVAA